MIDYSKLVLGREATAEEKEVLQQAYEKLDAVGLELLSTKPKPRP